MVDSETGYSRIQWQNQNTSYYMPSSDSSDFVLTMPSNDENINSEFIIF